MVNQKLDQGGSFPIWHYDINVVRDPSPFNLTLHKSERARREHDSIVHQQRSPKSSDKCYSSFFVSTNASASKIRSTF
jgi:hypothetical protein